MGDHLNDHPSEPLVWSLTRGEGPNEAPAGGWAYRLAMGSSPELDRLTLELALEQKAFIDRAAELTGKTTSDFCVSVLVPIAADVVRDQNLRDALNEALDRPAQPSRALSKLFRRPSVFEE